MYIDEQVYYLWEVFGVVLDVQTIQRMLKRVKWSKKLVRFCLYFDDYF
ncbi:MAG: winged helix-turn-helix domain-containing protein [Bacteroidetes bacterium]|nr:MAG: winged helix-turn-helix domain-containing protein [Bacteroidota bacterium]